MGFIAPPAYSLAIGLGGILSGGWRALRGGESGTREQSLGAGAIAGEAVTGVVIAALIAAGFLGR